MTPSDHPLVTPELVRYLDEAHPNRCPDVSMTDREIWMAAGAARVVEGLKAALAEQTARAVTVTQDPENVHLPKDAGRANPGAAPGAPSGGPSGPGNRIE